MNYSPVSAVVAASAVGDLGEELMGGRKLVRMIFWKICLIEHHSPAKNSSDPLSFQKGSERFSGRFVSSNITFLPKSVLTPLRPEFGILEEGRPLTISTRGCCCSGIA
jgi:hypothetical protein